MEYLVGDTARHPVVHVALYCGRLELFQLWSALSPFPHVYLGHTNPTPPGKCCDDRVDSARDLAYHSIQF